MLTLAWDDRNRLVQADIPVAYDEGPTYHALIGFRTAPGYQAKVRNITIEVTDDPVD